MSGDIVKRLRSMHHDLRQGAFYTHHQDPLWDVTDEAADEIERLRAEVERLRASDQGGAQRLEWDEDEHWLVLDDGDVQSWNLPVLATEEATYEDLLAALRAALRGGGS